MRGLYSQYLFARVFDVVATYLLQVIYSDSGIVQENITVVAWNASHFAIFFLRMNIKNQSFIFFFRI